MVTTSLLHFPEGKRPSQQCKTAPPGISAGNTGLVPARAGPDGHHPAGVALQARVPAAPRSCPYKGGWYGARVVEAGQWFPSSKTCSVCGAVNGDLQREPDWDCAECGAHHDRNENAARNLRKLALLAVGEKVMLPYGEALAGGGSVIGETAPDEGRTKQATTVTPQLTLAV